MICLRLLSSISALVLSRIVFLSLFDIPLYDNFPRLRLYEQTFHSLTPILYITKSRSDTPSCFLSFVSAFVYI